MDPKIGVVGLGYVGLPLLLAFARKFSGTVGYDIDEKKVSALKRGIDPTREGLEQEISSSKALFTSDAKALKNCNFFVVGVPTPVDNNNNPDLRALLGACRAVAGALGKGSIVVFESTVYPGVTEDICGPVLEEVSHLKRGVDFKLAYSPERINPGDKEHSLENVIKVVSGEDQATLDCVASVYSAVVRAGVFRAKSIKVAEAAKVIENTQRDLNIALMNELSMIFDLMNIRSRDVLDAAGTKWNFLPFGPGLVGGHCIGVDPYYLTTKAEQLGYHPQVILAGRRINDNMGAHVAQRIVKLMVNSGSVIKGARVGVLGLTFKENVADIRNSRVPDIISELEEFGVVCLVNDPYAEQLHAQHEYGLSLVPWEEMHDLDALVLSVKHRFYLDMPLEKLCGQVRKGGIIVDVKAALPPEKLRNDLVYWSL